MTENPTAAYLAAMNAVDDAEADAQLAFLEAAGPGDVGAVLDLMGRAIEPGDDPRLLLGLAALRRILGAD